MIVLAWIAWTVAALLAVVVLIIVGVLVSRIVVAGRVADDGVAVEGRVGAIAVRFDSVRDVLVVRLAGVRVYRGRASSAKSKDDADAEDDRPKDAGAEGETREAKPKRRGWRPGPAATRRLARTALRVVRRWIRLVRIDRLHIEAVIASDDPAWTGEAYGMACAAAAWLRQAWPAVDVDLAVDFVATRPRGAAEGRIALRPVRFLPGLARVGWSYWSERRRSRRGRTARNRSGDGKGRARWWPRSS